MMQRHLTSVKTTTTIISVHRNRWQWLYTTVRCLSLNITQGASLVNFRLFHKQFKINQNEKRSTQRQRVCLNWKEEVVDETCENFDQASFLWLKCIHKQSFIFCAWCLLVTVQETQNHVSPKQCGADMKINTCFSPMSLSFKRQCASKNWCDVIALQMITPLSSPEMRWCCYQNGN